MLVFGNHYKNIKTAVFNINVLHSTMQDSYIYFNLDLNTYFQSILDNQKKG